MCSRTGFKWTNGSVVRLFQSVVLITELVILHVLQMLRIVADVSPSQ